MPTMTVMPENKTYPTTEGISILQALINAGLNVMHKCGGEAKCGSCHIFVLDGRKGLSKVQRLENEKLDTIVGVGSKSRLACQTIIGTDNFSIELLGFASGG